MSHPDTGFSFKNRHIPKFKEAIEVCLELHNKVPHFTIIGWDVTVDDSEKIKILEWNGDGCDIKFSEATTGPCFLGFDWERYKGLGKKAISGLRAWLLLVRLSIHLHQTS